MSKLKKILFNWKIILMLIFVVMAIIAIYPNPYTKGVTIKSIERNSAAALGGMNNPLTEETPVARERIIEVNGKDIIDIESFYSSIESIKANDTVFIRTTKSSYTLIAEPNVIKLDEFENKTIFNEETNTSEIIQVQKTSSYGVKDLGIKVGEAPKTNIIKGLDLQGGTRVILKPETKTSDEQMSFIIESLKQRLNVYGLSDVVIRQASDLSDNNYILVEIAGANEEEINSLLAQQGKFEAKIQNKTVFEGGEKDITYVCTAGDCSGIFRQCAQVSDAEWSCGFQFSIEITSHAAKKFADITSQVPVSEDGQYLTEKIELYLDSELFDDLNIGADLKGRETQQISISGPGIGATEEEAIQNALDNMKKLQTVLQTGSIPVKLNIEKADNISPSLGSNFSKNALIMGLAAIFAVVLIVLIRYRNPTIAISMALTIVVELILLIGFAAFIRWNIDLAAVAGILIAVGTGVDHQIVIVDEVLTKDQEKYQSWKSKVKGAFFIIFGAYLTTLFAMMPLFAAGAGLLRGFALTTIIGISTGVFIARPAFAAAIEILLGQED